jgi:transposase
MPPKVQLKLHLSLEELKTHYRQAKDTAEARRWHLLYLVAQQWTIKQAAQVVGLNYDYAKEIVRRYNQEGPDAIKNRNQKRRASVRSLLTLAQQEELQKALRTPPPDGGKWSGPKVARWIAEKTGREHVWSQRGWDYLKRFGGQEQGTRSEKAKECQEKKKRSS